MGNPGFSLSGTSCFMSLVGSVDDFSWQALNTRSQGRESVVCNSPLCCVSAIGSIASSIVYCVESDLSCSGKAPREDRLEEGGFAIS